jgi:NADH-ubiquinone oxidoreductase chain 5
LVYYSLTGDFNTSALNCLNDEAWTISKGITGLLVIAVIGGRILSWLIFPSPSIICLPPILKFLTLFVCIRGGLLGYLISNISLYFVNKSLTFYKSSFFIRSIWFMPNLSTRGSIFYPLFIGIRVIKSFDQGWREYFGGQKIYTLIRYFSIFNQFLQNNNLKIYLISFVLWIIVLVIILIV